MRICLVTREYPSLGSHGGIGTYTHNLVKGLAARGHDVTVIARSEGPLKPFEENGVRVEPVDAPDRWYLPAGNRFVGMTSRALPFTRAASLRFSELAARRPFDVVEVPEYQGWGLGVAMAARCPVVVRLHTHTALVRRLNDVSMDLDARIIARMEGATIRRGDVVLANSSALAGEARKDFGFQRIGVLPLGIDAERFAPRDPHWLRQELGLAPEAPIVLYVGRLERRKGVEALVEAFGRVRATSPKAVLVMAGFSTDTGPNGQGLLGVLRDRLQALGALANVRFMGHVPYQDLPRYYAGCDLFVAPSRYEPFGMIYLEAMACGKAVVGTDVGGVPEIVQHGRTGYLVAPDDPLALADALRELLQYPSWRERIGEAARDHVHASFSLPVIAAATERQYLNVMLARQGDSAPMPIRRAA
jgi:glycosyltransferase involved in cell wall biosynthesis